LTSRLTDALERARAKSSEHTEPVAPVAGHDDVSAVPGPWQFDAEDEAGLESAESTSAIDSVLRDDMSLEHVQYPFASTPALAARLVVGAEPNHTLVEQFRHLAASLHHAQLRTGARTVMIASAVESEGKTTTAANIALTFSHSHRRRVLLIDADLRRPSIHHLFQLPNREGLTDALKVVTPGTPLPLHEVSPTLSVLTAGAPTSDPMSVLVSDMMRQFIREASEQYDWIVLDTPPVALLSDANLLSAMIDLAIVVVNANSTPYPLVRRAIEAIGPSKVLGTLLNRAQRSDIAVGYRYKYSYGYSYAPKPSPPVKKSWLLPFRRKG
jgi:capsular exopolysaccharide synthesis family protein